MSGIEIVALVVGVFPLAISALEHYKDVHNARDLLGRFESEDRKTLDDIRDEKLFFHLNLEEVLLSNREQGAFEEDDFERLLGDPTGARWKDENIQCALEDRLGQTYSRFVEIAASLHTLLSRLLPILISDKPYLQARMKTKIVSLQTPCRALNCKYFM